MSRQQSASGRWPAQDAELKEEETRDLSNQVNNPYVDTVDNYYVHSIGHLLIHIDSLANFNVSPFYYVRSPGKSDIQCKSVTVLLWMPDNDNEDTTVFPVWTTMAFSNLSRILEVKEWLIPVVLVLTFKEIL